MSSESTHAKTVADILPSQWYPRTKRMDLRFDGAKQLMLAVLVDALRCFQTNSNSGTRRRSLAETEAWIADRDAQGPFAFETVCAMLGIDANRLRETVGEWREQRISRQDVRRQIRQLGQINGRRVVSSIARRR